MSKNVLVINGGRYFGEIKSFDKKVEKEWGVDHTDMIQIGNDAGNPVLLPLAMCIIEKNDNPKHAHAIDCDAPIGV